MTDSQPASHRRLSVAMIARDCADIIASSLESVRNVADEIVVVDTGSRDRTREIAVSHASRVLDWEWTDDFAAARNACLSHVTGEWVLWLDAGETIAPGDAEQLRKLVDRECDANCAYLVMVQTPAANHEMADEQAGRIRLHPRRAGIEFTGRIREEIQTAVEALEMEIELAPFALVRSRREHDPDVKRAKAERNVRLAALEIQEHGVLPSPLLAMADACVALGEASEGIDFFSKAIEIAPRDSTLMLEGFYGILAALDQTPQVRDKQLALCQQALEIFPLDAQLLCAMGNYLQRQSHLDLACRSFEAAARFGQVDPQTWHLVEIGDVATCCQASCQELLGDAEGARRNLESSLAIKPNSQRLRRQLLEFYIRRDCRKEALDLVEQLATQTNREGLRTAIRGACLAAKQDWIPALAYLQTAYGSGCRDVICLRALVTTYLATGDQAAAENTLAEWRRVQPDSGEARRLENELCRLHSTRQSPLSAASPSDVSADSFSDRRLRLDVQSESPAPAPKSATWPAERAKLDVRR